MQTLDHTFVAPLGSKKFMMLTAMLLLGSGCGVKSTSESQPRSADSVTRPPIQIAEAQEAVPTAPSIPTETPPSNSALSALAQTITQAYQTAKATGQTAATSARDWIMDDISSTNRWEYRVVATGLADPARLETLLNELGRDGWQCFHVQANAPSMTFYLQRHPASLSRNIPLSDLLKVIPYLGLGQGEK